MTPLRARVRDGRLVIDEPTNLPEGMILDLVIDDEADDLDPDDRAALHAALERGRQDASKGSVVSAESVIKRLRERE